VKARRKQPPPSARMAASRALMRVSRGAASQEALSDSLREAALADPRDRALTTELVYGVLRWRRRLAHDLGPLVHQGFDTIEPMARILLLVGAYQIMHLDRIPPPVAVSATLDTARAMGGSRLTGLLNGVLRRLVANPPAAPVGEGVDAVGIRTSLPSWIVEALQKAYGDAAESEGLALRQRAFNTVRPTLARGGATALAESLASDGFATEEAAHGTCVVTGPGDPFSTTAFRNGHFVPQDPASLAVVNDLGELKGLRVLDLCAGRGIKATAMLDRGAHVTAVDISASKLRHAQVLAEKLGVGAHLEVLAGDPTRASLELGTYDVVLVDAPCSGLGTLRRHPEIAWRRQPEDVARLAALQSLLLNAGARHVAPGGLLSYAVCSFTEVEGMPTLEDPAVVGMDLVSRSASRPSEGVDAFQTLLLRAPDVNLSA
jgi:16S rRNA (cytosine967-C5)-methyltransferase